MSLLVDAPCPVIFTYVEGDNLPLLFGDFSQPITGYTLTLVIRRPDDTTVSIGPGTIIDDVNGQFSFGPFAPTDLVEGFQRACIEFVDASGDKTTTPNLYLNVVKRC